MASSDPDKVLAAALEELRVSGARDGAADGTPARSSPRDGAAADEFHDFDEMEAEDEGFHDAEGEAWPTYGGVPTASAFHDDVSPHAHTRTVDRAAASPSSSASVAASTAAAAAAPSQSSSSDASFGDDSWSEALHGPRLSRIARTHTEADDVPDDSKDAARAAACKEEGNRLYSKGEHARAIECYTDALRYVPRGGDFSSVTAVYFANRAAAHMAQSSFADVVYDCDRALELDPKYLRAIMRRAAALERLKKYEDAIKDCEAWLELEPSAPLPRESITRLKRLVSERDEKVKEEMMGKLKEMGNWVLGKFGLSLDNFKAVQDPATGSYSISFQQ